MLNSKYPSFCVTTSSSSAVKEGDSFTTFINTKGVKEGTTLYWALSGAGVTPSDFASNSLSGSGNVDQNGSLIFKNLVANDFKREGDENVSIKLYSDSDHTKEVGNHSILIKDTSIDDFASNINTDGQIDQCSFSENKK